MEHACHELQPRSCGEVRRAASKRKVPFTVAASATNMVAAAMENFESKQPRKGFFGVCKQQQPLSCYTLLPDHIGKNGQFCHQTPTKYDKNVITIQCFPLLDKPYF